MGLAAQLPFATAGPVWAIAALVAAGLGGWRLVATWRRGHLDRASRAAALLLAASGATLLVTATVHQPIPRYLLVAVALLAVLAGAEGWAWLYHARMPAQMRRRLVAAGTAGLIVYAGMAVGYAHLNRVEQTAQLAPLRTAAIEIADGQPCAVATGRVPQWTWYSGCAAVRHGGLDARDEPRRYVALMEGSKREPDPAEADRIRRELGPPVVVAPRRTPTGRLGGLEVYAVE